MKKWISLLLVLALLGACALAEEAAANEALAEEAAVSEALAVGTFTRLADGQEVDLDGNGTKERLSFVAKTSDDHSSYYLAVNGLEARSDDAIALRGDVYAVRFSSVEGAFLFIPDYGMSDDPISYIYHYVRGLDERDVESLDYMGAVEAFPDNMTVTGQNTFTTYLRAFTLFTWTRPADFVVATGYHWDGDNAAWSFGIAEVPRDLYPVGAHVTVKVELPLLTSRTDETVCRTLKPGDKAVVAATDDREWYYIYAYTDDYATPLGGWVRLDSDPETFDGLLINGVSVSGADAFDGLLYAD